MTSCPSRQQLDRYLDEQLSGPEREAVESHVAECRACQLALEKVARGGDTGVLQSWHASHSGQLYEPKGDFLRRVELAALAGSKSDVVVEATGAYQSPAHSVPGVASVRSLSDQPTRHAPPGAHVDFSADAGLPAGTMLGQYRILGELGAGGMGHVYKAVHVAMERTVALKVIAPHLLRDARARARFQQEVRTAARLHHPNIVMAHDAAEARGLSFLVMEYVEGATLSSLVADQGLPPVPLACEIIRQAALGLQHAHDKGMVHRDIKPGNLMVAAQHTPGSGAIVSPPNRGHTLPGWPSAPLVKILDFGVARLREWGSDGEPLKIKPLTQEGCVVGTPEFMSPEQACDSRMVDIRSDIYSLGCTFYFLLAGRPPFSATTALETMVQHLKQPLPPIESFRPGLPAGLTSIVNKMLAKSADQRYQTPAELAEALLPWTANLAASAVGPEVAVPQVGCEPTAPLGVEALQPTHANGPAGTQPPGTAGAAITARSTPPTSSHSMTFLALLSLVAVSAVAFWAIMNFFERPQPLDEGEPADQQVNRLGMKFIRLPRGEFQRAVGPRGQKTAIDHDFEVAATEVTRGQFGRFVQASGYKTLAEAGGPDNRGCFVPTADGGKWWPTMNWANCGQDEVDLPVTCVAWNDAVAFCNWLSSREGKQPCYQAAGNGWICRFDVDGYRLPTDAEWEYAARAGSEKLLPAPAAGLQDFGWFRPLAENKPHRVGQLRPNSHDLHDVWGNVWEWCWDWYSPEPQGQTGPAKGNQRVVWGGGWNDTAEKIMHEPRKGQPPDYRSTDLGFRIVRTLPAR